MDYTEEREAAFEDLAFLKDADEEVILKILNEKYEEFFLKFSDRLDDVLYKKRINKLSDKEKKNYLYKALKDAGCTISEKTVYNWLTKQYSQLSRDNIYALCFALHLDIHDSEWFFTHVCHERPFYCSDAKEAIFYYCLKNGIDYKKCVKLYKDYDSHKESKPNSVSNDIKYTEEIREDLDNIDSIEDLMNYLIENCFDSQNNRSARRELNKLLYGKSNPNDVVVRPYLKPSEEELKKINELRSALGKIKREKRKEICIEINELRSVLEKIKREKGKEIQIEITETTKEYENLNNKALILQDFIERGAPLYLEDLKSDEFGSKLKPSEEKLESINELRSDLMKIIEEKRKIIHIDITEAKKEYDNLNNTALILQEFFKIDHLYLEELESVSFGSNTFLINQILMPQKNTGIISRAEFSKELPVLVTKNFPDRKTLENALSNEKNISFDQMRKLLILLCFYYFWFLEEIKVNKCEEISLFDECVNFINGVLRDAGYWELYCGNPYDFIFLFCAANDAPLIIFRDLIFKIIEEKKGNENDDSSEASG